MTSATASPSRIKNIQIQSKIKDPTLEDLANSEKEHADKISKSGENESRRVFTNYAYRTVFKNDINKWRHYLVDSIGLLFNVSKNDEENTFRMIFGFYAKDTTEASFKQIQKESSIKLKDDYIKLYRYRKFINLIKVDIQSDDNLSFYNEIVNFYGIVNKQIDQSKDLMDSSFLKRMNIYVASKLANNSDLDKKTIALFSDNYEKNIKASSEGLTTSKTYYGECRYSAQGIYPGNSTLEIREGNRVYITADIRYERGGGTSISFSGKIMKSNEDFIIKSNENDIFNIKLGAYICGGSYLELNGTGKNNAISMIYNF